MTQNGPCGGITRRGHFLTTEISSLHEELRTFFATRLPASQDAEDFAQQVFERAVAGGKTFDRALLFTIAHGLLKNEYRDAERAEGEPLNRLDNQFEDRPMQGASDRAALVDPENEWGTTQLPAYTVEDAIFAGNFDRAVRVLENDPRDAFILGELRGLPVRESGAVLGISFATAARHERAATTHIRKELAR